LSREPLDDWLADLEKRTPPHQIELGLERVGQVYDALFAEDPWINTRIITIGGTNGKGSTVAFCEAIARAHGLSTLAYTSPHITRFNERVRINGSEASDADWLHALNEVETARAEVHLTYFEHVTLAALVIAKAHAPDLLLLEVGLGGRLDAVNVVDADVSVITSIGLDHMDYLGPTRTHIGREKLGIARANRPLVLAEADWPEALEEALVASGATLWRVGLHWDWLIEDVSTSGHSGQWTLRFHSEPQGSWSLPQPNLVGPHQISNAAAAIVAFCCVLGAQQLLPGAVAQGLTEVQLAGRFEQVATAPAVFLDVAHNAQAAECLKEALMAASAGDAAGGETVAVFGALADKDVEAMVDALDGVFDRWWLGDLSGPRGQSAQALAGRLINRGVKAPIEAVKSIPEALDLALANASIHDRVVVFGSFHVLSEVQSRWPSRE